MLHLGLLSGSGVHQSQSGGTLSVWFPSGHGNLSVCLTIRDREADDHEGSGWVGVGGVVKPLDHLSQSFRVGGEVVFGLTTDKVHPFLVSLSAYFTLRKSLKYASCR